MDEMEDFKKTVDEDIIHCEAVWAEFSHDKDKLQELFQTMLFRYSEKIQGFTEEMLVISLFENSALMAQTYRENIKCLIERLKAFQANGYKNEGLKEYYLNQDANTILQYNLDFSQVCADIGMLSNLSSFEKEDILKKLTEMEQICAQPISKAKKWDMLRPYVVWLSGKDVTVALKLLPLFFNI